MAGVKLSAEVNGFKSAMKQAQSSVKMLDAELKLNAAQYKASGDREEYMAGRARLLSQQITQQEAAVKAAEDALRQMTSDGVDKASVAYTQMQAAVAKARTDLVNLQAAAANAGGELGDMAEAGESAGQSLSSIDKGIKFQNIKSALDSITGVLTGMVKKALEFGDAVWNWGRNAAAWADDLNTTAKMYGMDAETLQGYQYAANLIDTSVDDMIKGTDKLTQRIKSAEEGYLAITTDTTAYAIAVKDVQGNMRSQSDVMWDFLDILGQIGNETERNTLAQEYFGKSYRELIPLIEAGREGWDEAARGAKIISQDDVNKLNDYNDSLDEFDQHLNAMKMQIFADLAPALSQITDALTRMVDRIGEWAASDEGRATLDRLGQAVANLIDSFANGDFEQLFTNATEAVGKIAEWLSTITSEDIMSALKTIGTIIAGWTIGSKLLEFMVFAKSFGLGGGGGSAGGGGGAAGAAGASAAGGGGWLGAGAAALAMYALVKKLTDMTTSENENPGKGGWSDVISWVKNNTSENSIANREVGGYVGNIYHTISGNNLSYAGIETNDSPKATAVVYVSDLPPGISFTSSSSAKSTAQDAGAEIAEANYEGMLANISMAYAAGGALAAAFASGAAAGAGSGGSTYNSEFINSVNVYGATNPAEIAAAYRSYMQQTQAGVGS